MEVRLYRGFIPDSNVMSTESDLRPYWLLRWGEAYKGVTRISEAQKSKARKSAYVE